MTRAHHDLNGAEEQIEAADASGYDLFHAALALMLVAGLILGFAVGRFG